MKRLRRNKRAFTLAELVVAIAITALIASVVSVLVGSVIHIQRSAEITAQLANVSQRLHTSLHSQLACVDKVKLFDKQANPSSILNSEYRYYIYVDSDRDKHLKLRSKSDSDPSEVLMHSDSYNGATIETFEVTVGAIEEKASRDDSTPHVCYRILYIYTVLKKDGVEYEHVSTVRLYNMQQYGNNIVVDGKTSEEMKTVVYNPETPLAKLPTYGIIAFGYEGGGS